MERYAYDPYGQVQVFDAAWTPRAGSAYGNAILFAGYYRDDETGLYHVRHRMYHPQLGRWLQRDPAGYVDGLNLYEYVGGNPIGAVDPSGLDGFAEWFLDVTGGYDDGPAQTATDIFAGCADAVTGGLTA